MHRLIVSLFAIASWMLIAGCSLDDTPSLGKDAARLLEGTQVPAGWNALSPVEPLGFSATQRFQVPETVAPIDVVPPKGYRLVEPGEASALRAPVDGDLVAEWVGPAPTEATRCVLRLTGDADGIELLASCLDEWDGEPRRP